MVTTFGNVSSDAAMRGPGMKNQREMEFVPPLERLFFHRLVVDESHMLKNGAGVSTKAITAVHASLRWCMSGTPFGNDVSDLHGQLRFLHSR